MVNRGKVFLEAMILNSDFKTCMDDGQIKRTVWKLYW